MTERVVRYTRMDRNQVKLSRVTEAFLWKVDRWLKNKPTGQMSITVEMNANQGGLGEVFIEEKERGRV